MTMVTGSGSYMVSFSEYIDQAYSMYSRDMHEDILLVNGNTVVLEIFAVEKCSLFLQYFPCCGYMTIVKFIDTDFLNTPVCKDNIYHINLQT